MTFNCQWTAYLRIKWLFWVLFEKMKSFIRCKLFQSVQGVTISYVKYISSETPSQKINWMSVWELWFSLSFTIVIHFVRIAQSSPSEFTADKELGMKMILSAMSCLISACLTRSQNIYNFKTPAMKTVFGKWSFSFAVLHEWKRLPFELKPLSVENASRKQLKKFILIST